MEPVVVRVAPKKWMRMGEIVLRDAGCVKAANFRKWKRRTMNNQHRTPNAQTRGDRRSEFEVHCSMFRVSVRLHRIPLALQKKWTINPKPLESEPPL
jgi:hypothetical protein